MDLVLKFRTGETWAVEIKRGLSPVLKPGFFSAVEDIAPDTTECQAGHPVAPYPRILGMHPRTPRSGHRFDERNEQYNWLEGIRAN